MMNQTSPFLTLLLRLFSGLAGGLLGMIFALLLLFLASFHQPVADELVASYSVVVILGMVFAGTMISNLFVAFFLTLVNSGKYRRQPLLFHVFFFTVALFVFAIPFYLFAADSVLSTAGIHFLFSALVAALLCEIASGREYILTGLLGILFSGTFLLGIFTILLRVFANDSVILIFALPLAWLMIPVGIFLAEILHTAWYRLYGRKPLALD